MNPRYVFLSGFVAGVGIKPAGEVLKNFIQAILELYRALVVEMIPDFLSLGEKTSAPEPIVYMSWGLVGWLLIMTFVLSLVWTVRKVRRQ